MTDARDDAAAHYERLLARHYAWMLGDFETAAAEQRDLLARLGLQWSRSDRVGTALDLGAGTGIQSVALERLGYHVVAVDSSEHLLRELAARPDISSVSPVVGDIREVTTIDAVRRVVAASGGFDAVVCMGDTLTHLSTRADVERLIHDARDLLLPSGRLALSFRDLTHELTGLDRFIPVRNDADRIMTCFLEYRADTVVVHDLVHVRGGAGWSLQKSSYPKLRLPPAWVAERLRAASFDVTYEGAAGRLVALAARRR